MMLDRTKNSLQLRKRRGVTMVMMLILVPIIMLIAVSYVEPIIRSYRAGVNDQKTLLAKSVADSMFEVALWESRGGGTGDVTSGCICDSPPCGDPDLGANCNDESITFDFGTATGEWHVFGTPELDDEHLIDIDGNGTGDWYTVPSPGSGDAGGTYCSTAEPVVNEDMMGDALESLVGNRGALGTTADAFDWPCHWNKIREGETVAIPLYTDDGTTVNNPVDLGLDRFDLRIRAACNPDALPDDPEEFDQEICGAGERYELNETIGPDFEKTVIVLWEIVGKNEDKNGEQVILSGTEFGPIFTFFSNKNINNINYSLADNSFIEDNKRINGNLLNLLTPLYKPTLNLQVIHTLRDAQDNTIPYLEYQFKAPISLSSDLPISNTSKVVRVDVMVDGGYSETLEKTIALPKPISGFVISQ